MHSLCSEDAVLKYPGVFIPYPRCGCQAEYPPEWIPCPQCSSSWRAGPRLEEKKQLISLSVQQLKHDQSNFRTSDAALFLNACLTQDLLFCQLDSCEK